MFDFAENDLIITAVLLRRPVRITVHGPIVEIVEAQPIAAPPAFLPNSLNAIRPWQQGQEAVNVLPVVSVTSTIDYEAVIPGELRAPDGSSRLRRYPPR